MARDRHDTLDDDEEEDERLPLVRPRLPPPPARRRGGRAVVTALMVLGLGGGLGTMAYWAITTDLSDLVSRLRAGLDPRTLTAFLDVGDRAPRLSLQLPGAAEPPAVAGGLLTPPGGAVRPVRDPAPDPEPAEPPVPSPAPVEPTPALPLPPPPPLAEPPPVPAVAAPLAPVGRNGRSDPRSDAVTIPPQPPPRSADKPPSFDALPERKGEKAAPLPAAPLREMLRRGAAGDLPVPGPDGRQPWQVYARPWAGPADRGKVAVVVADLGLDRVATEAAITRLPPEVTLAFSPYAAGLDKWIRKARDHGHEVVMVLPAEAAGSAFADPGPYALTVAATPEANLGRLETVMARGPGAVGLLVAGEAFAASPQMGQILATARDHGLLVVGPGTAPPGRAPALARVTATVDQDLYREAIDLRLNQISVAARTRRQAVAVLHPRPLSFERLVGWLAGLSGQGLVLAPVSALASPPAAGPP